jgi:uncharacterized protein (DUF1501 family)
MSSRRDFIKLAGLNVLGLSVLPSFMQHSLAQTIKSLPASLRKKTLVFIFMRGAADGLAIVPPVKDTYYNKALRPSLFTGSDIALKLDGYFGLHPALKDIYPLWEQGIFSIVHQCGTPGGTRSHFDAQDFMESGTPGVKSTEDGFLDRMVGEMAAKSSPLRIVALQSNLPRSLWGTHGAFAMNDIKEFQNDKGISSPSIGKNFESMYDQALDEVLKGTGKKTFQSLDILKKLPETSSDANYPNSALGKRLQDIAKLIRGDVGLELAVTECGGWDTHQRQGNEQGPLAKNLNDLGLSIAAFTKELGSKMEDVCLITMTEFGRTVHENGTGGTDHGYGSVMMAFGGGVKGKQVINKWKDLKKENLFEERDLSISFDYRDVWKEILSAHYGIKDFVKIFPNYQLSPDRIGLMRDKV